jgi:hypothetical protein
MCVIIVCPKGVALPSVDELKAAYMRNPDGCGFVSESDHYKSLHFSTFIRRLMKRDINENVIIHFRFATHGSVCVKNSIRFIMLGADREHPIMGEPITSLVERMAILDTDRTMSSKSKMYDYILIYISLHQSTYKCREMQALIMVRLAHKSATIGISHIRCLQLIYGWQSNTFRTYNNNTHIFTLSFS